MKSLSLLLLLSLHFTTFAATFTVTNTDDSGPNSFRQAILDAQANLGADEIQFNIPGAGPHIIYLNSSLPIITTPIDINATTQPTWMLGSLVLDGQSLLQIAFRFETTNCSLQGLQLTNFTFSAIEAFDADNLTIQNCLINNFSSIDGVGIFLQNCDNVLINDCKIGTNAAGDANESGDGIAGILTVGLTNSTIQNCQISGFFQIATNKGWAVYFDGVGNTGNTIANNLIGVNASSTATLPNYIGIQLSQNSENNAITNNVIGGSVLSGIVLQTLGGL